jgi:hypothetical protein
VGGVIRVVLVREPDRWAPYFATDPDLTVASILGALSDRSALEQVYHDVKEVHGAGQQQLRHVWANVGAWNLIGWWHTLVELWAWHCSHVGLCDRSESPWDAAERRPSHADRCRGLRREALKEEYSHLPAMAGLRPKIRRFIRRLMKAAAWVREIRESADSREPSNSRPKGANGKMVGTPGKLLNYLSPTSRRSHRSFSL